MSSSTGEDPPSGTSSSSSSSSSVSLSSSASQTTPPLPLHQPPRQANPRKPSLILICPSGKTAISTRYHSILAKMQRDAHLIFALSLADVHRIMANEIIANSVAGFIVTDARIMGIYTDSDSDIEVDIKTGGGNTDAYAGADADKDGDMAALSRVLGTIVTGAYFYSYEHEHTYAQTHANRSRGTITRSGENRGNSTATAANPCEWTVVFAFDFPAQAARRPLRFAKYMAETFGVGWRMCGATKGKCSLEISERGLRKMGPRVYRGDKYKLRAVFLECVDERDKVLVVAKGASVGNGGLGSQGQPDNYLDEDDGDEDGDGGSLGERPMRVSDPETDSTAGVEGDFDIERVEVGDEGVGWTLAVDGNDPGGPSWVEEEDIDMIDAELLREEQDWADDELTPTEVSDGPSEDDDEDDENASSSSSDTDPPPNQRVIYVNVPDQRGNQNAMDSDERPSQDKKKKNKEKTPKRIANCPVAIHEVKSAVYQTGHRGQRARLRGFVGFVGHVEDNRSMASLILGMCSVKNTRPLPESMRVYLRDRNLG
ncbi:hypothetical protein BJX76DRAFT_347494 [Aspergillus varians]